MSRRTAEHIMRSSMAFFLLLLIMLRVDSGDALGYAFPQSWVNGSKLIIFLLVLWLAFGRLKTPRQTRPAH